MLCYGNNITELRLVRFWFYSQIAELIHNYHGVESRKITIGIAKRGFAVGLVMFVLVCFLEILTDKTSIGAT